MLIFILTLIAVGGAFALYQFGDQVLIRMATPQGRFDAREAGGGPDYAQPASWIARPDLAIGDNVSQWRPAGSPPPTLEPRRAAVFYIHPTTYLKGDRWNGPIDDADSKQRAALFVRSQASAFNHVAEIWAPKYRQAAYGAFLLKSEDASRAIDLAYADLNRAFDQFAKEVAPGRPIILAAHSQGSMHLLRLMADRKASLKDRLVAAYVAGWPVGIAADLPAAGLPACGAADQAQCLLSWQSFKDPANTRLVTQAWVGTTGLTGIPRNRQDMLCTNPLTGTRDGAASPAANQGTLVPNGDLTTATIERGRVGAHCDRGFLILDGDVPNLGPYVLPGNNYHVYDYALFWGSIRADAQRRLAAWQAR